MASNIRELIDRCVAKDSAAWAELWQMIEPIAVLPVQQVLHSQHVRGAEADDVLHDLYLNLQREDCQTLRNFRGVTEGQFRAYIKVVAERFAARWCLKAQEEQHLGSDVLEVLQLANPAEITEEEIEAAWQELYARMTPKDRRKLVIIRRVLQERAATGEKFGKSSRGQPSERTLRRWSAELERKYRRYL